MMFLHQVLKTVFQTWLDADLGFTVLINRICVTQISAACNDYYCI